MEHSRRLSPWIHWSHCHLEFTGTSKSKISKNGNGVHTQEFYRISTLQNCLNLPLTPNSWSTKVITIQVQLCREHLCATLIEEVGALWNVAGTGASMAAPVRRCQHTSESFYLLKYICSVTWWSHPRYILKVINIVNFPTPKDPAGNRSVLSQRKEPTLSTAWGTHLYMEQLGNLL